MFLQKLRESAGNIIRLDAVSYTHLVEVRPVKGGLTVDGLCIEAFGDRDCSIEAALAAVEVFITE